MKRRGNCYVTSEAIYHLLGGKAAGWRPMRVRHEGDTHWFIARRRNLAYPWERWNLEILDLTASQFKNPPPYHKAIGSGFLTKGPSKRAKALMDIMVWQSDERSATSD